MAEKKKRKTLGALVDAPDLPPRAKQDLPRPFQTGDRALSMDDITGSTNEIPGVPHDKSAGMSRGITRREDRERFLGPRAARKQADADAEEGRRQYRKRLDEEADPDSRYGTLGALALKRKKGVR